MKPIVSFLGLACFTCLGAPLSSQGGPADVLLNPGQGVSFQQVDFFLTSTPLEDTGFGLVQAEPLRLQTSTGMSAGYLNVALVGRLTRHERFRDLAPKVTWVVQNLYVQTQTSLDFPQVIVDLPGTFPDDPRTVSTYFTLNIPERQRDVTTLRAYALYSSQPVESGVDLLGRIGSVPYTLFPVTETDISTIGAPEDDEDCLPEITDPGIAPAPPPPPSLLAPSFWWRLPNIANQNAANNQCGPMAWANSLQFMEDTYGIPYLFAVPEPHLPGENGDNTLVGVLDAYMNRTVTDRCSGSGTNRCTIGMLDIPSRLPGLMDYLSVTFDITRFEMRHQGREAVFPDDCTGTFNFGITSVREGVEPTWEWMRDRIIEGYTVVIAYGRYSSVPGVGCMLVDKFTGGHILRVHSVGFTAGRQWIATVDDGNQDRMVDGMCTARGGLRDDLHWWVEDIDDDGRLNLSGMNWEISLAVALRVLPPGS